MDVCDLRERSIFGRAGAGDMRAFGAWLSCLILALLAGCAVPGGPPVGKGETPSPTMESTPRESHAPASPSPAATLSESGPGKTNLTGKDRRAWRAVLKWPDDCEDAFERTMDRETAGLEFYELASGRYLVEIKCTNGAYQGYQFYSYLDETKSPPAAKLLTFTTYESEDDDKSEKKKVEEVWGLPDFDAKAKSLKILNKYRGPGDCGSLATYEFREGVPSLKEFRLKSKCDGKGGGHPERWEKIVPSP
ncbi:MAG: DUF1176 domain-containing protein [Acidobacteria bacterium]|nr:DUF1176 domain-containing protein [Acidobacteriota bacterium]